MQKSYYKAMRLGRYLTPPCSQTRNNQIAYFDFKSKSE